MGTHVSERFNPAGSLRLPSACSCYHPEAFAASTRSFNQITARPAVDDRSNMRFIHRYFSFFLKGTLTFLVSLLILLIFLHSFPSLSNAEGAELNGLRVTYRILDHQGLRQLALIFGQWCYRSQPPGAIKLTSLQQEVIQLLICISVHRSLPGSLPELPFSLPALYSPHHSFSVW